MQCTIDLILFYLFMITNSLDRSRFLKTKLN